jgi:hypothetical protein
VLSPTGGVISSQEDVVHEMADGSRFVHGFTCERVSGASIRRQEPYFIERDRRF